MMGNRTYAAVIALSGLLAAVTGPGGGAGAMEVVGQEILFDRDHPEICVIADRPFSSSDSIIWTDYLRLSPDPAGLSARVRDNRICAMGLDHGQTYDLTLRDGAPAEDGSRLAALSALEIYVPDRQPSARFDPQGRVFPLGLGQGIPLTTVNVGSADLSLLRVDPRNIPLVSDSWMQYGDLSQWAIDNLEENDGEAVWSGSVAIQASERNRPTTTIVPLSDILPDMRPGLYVMTANVEDGQDAEWIGQATQWFVATDTGLSALSSDAGLHVAATSLTTNAPLANIDLTLVARNNRVLGTATTDGDGFAVFPPGLIRGTGGSAPTMLHAIAGSSDFAYLDLARSGHDFLDRGGDGRTAPGPLDGQAITDRGLYRPGESVILSVLLRDPRGEAVTGIPLTVTTINPVRNEFDRRIITDTAGGYREAIDIPPTAPTGGWTLRVSVGDDGPVVAETNIFVSDFVPPQIDVDVTAQRITDSSGAPAIEAAVEGNFFFGVPAADLTGTVEVLVRAAETPFPDYPDFRFGLEQMPFFPEREEPVAIRLDSQGRATATVHHQVRDTARQPLEAVVTANIDEPGGRVATSQTTVALNDASLYIGVLPDQPDHSGPDEDAGFTVLAVDAEGAPLPGVTLTYDIFRENYDYIWYRDYGSWYAEELITDTRIGGGDLTTADDGMARLAEPVSWGRYRLEVYAPGDELAETSVRFAAGYWGAGDDRETADNVTLSLDRASYSPGDVARVLIETPYPAADLLVAVADSSVRSLQRVSADDGTAAIDIPVGSDWENGAYVLVTAIAPPEAVSGPLPRRAVGLQWIGLNRERATLDVAIEAEPVILPQSDAPVTLTVTGSDGSAARANVILTAVDEAVLGLTNHPVPDPIGHSFGQRRASVDLHDLYGSLIDPSGDRVGVLTTGGDWALGDPQGLPDPSIEVAAWVSDILETDEQGRVTATLPVPDFNGRLRLTAVTWTHDRMGAGRSDVTVRAPVIADLVLPRFLSVGDRADATLRLQNLDGPAGDYTLTITGDGIVGLAGPSVQTVRLDDQGVWSDRIVVSGVGTGTGTLSLQLDGPEGFSLQRTRRLGVRSPHPPESRTLLSTIQPGGSLVLSDDILADFMPGTTRISQVIGAGPTIDIPGLTARLVDYPFSCVEQTTSRAFPLMMFSDTSFAPALAGLETPRQSVQDAIFTVTAQQTSSGGFALWGPGGYETLWLTAYVTDFLLEAASRGYIVPSAPLNAALSWLDGRTSGFTDDPDILDAQLYGLYVLTRSGRNTLADLRYLFETRLDSLPSGVGLAALAAGLAEQGDLDRAAQVIERSTAPDAGILGNRTTDSQRGDYGTALRDRAALVALARTPDGLMPEQQGGASTATIMSELWSDIAAAMADTRYPNTQELAWSLRAASAAMAAQGPMTLLIGDDRITDRLAPVTRTIETSTLVTGARIENLGDTPVQQTLTVRGLPWTAPAASENRASLTRTFHAPTGKPIEPDSMQSGDALIMVLSGVVPGDRRNMVIEQWLPAGWEAEDLRLGGDAIATVYPGLRSAVGAFTPTLAVDIRDDRVSAALDPDHPDRTVQVAFLLRAVTPGTFTLPGAYLEDMYDPSVHARMAATTITVHGPE